MERRDVTNQSSPDLHNRGWGFALAIIALAIVANAAAYSIHRATYLKPDKPVPATVRATAR